MQQYGPSPHLADDGTEVRPRLMKHLEQSLRAIAEQVACAGTGLWLFDGPEDDDALRCLACYDALCDRVETVRRHAIVAGGRGLFDALSCEAHVVDDPCSGVLQGLVSGGTHGSGGEAPLTRMACAFSLNGRLLGALICSQPTTGSSWSHRQRLTATRASASLALSLSRDGEAAFSALVARQRDAAP